MKKSKFTESQIIKILSAQESGVSVSEICREHGISQGTFYNWKSKILWHGSFSAQTVIFPKNSYIDNCSIFNNLGK